MPEVKKKVQPYLVEMVCPVCKEGKMEPLGDIVLTTDPPKFPHKCNKCGNGDYYMERYPKISYKSIEDEEA